MHRHLNSNTTHLSNTSFTLPSLQRLARQVVQLTWCILGYVFCYRTERCSAIAAAQRIAAFPSLPLLLEGGHGLVREGLLARWHDELSSPGAEQPAQTRANGHCHIQHSVTTWESSSLPCPFSNLRYLFVTAWAAERLK